jgi:leucyl-tRNA---protein transferase
VKIREKLFCIWASFNELISIKKQDSWSLERRIRFMELARMEGPASPCSYIPGLDSTLEYRYSIGIQADVYYGMLRRGWRRFGYTFFRPVCIGCSKCKSLRVCISKFKATKSQRRSVKKNKDIQVIVRTPSMTAQHLILYDKYHRDMHKRRGWPLQSHDQDEYFESFVAGAGDFAREFLYFKARKLVGVGLVDILPEGLSSVYFFHDPEWRKQSPGTFSVITEIDFARRLGKEYLYLGYWIKENQSMEYKGRYSPHEILQGYVDDADEPLWLLPTSQKFAV